jgi:predicted RNA-binding Zn-ribbon protein involved in translation (DUF1610 family)
MYVNKGKKAIEFRSQEGEQRRLASVQTDEFGQKMSIVMKERLKDKQLREKISVNTKKGWAKRKAKLNGLQGELDFETHKLGDRCNSKDLGLTTDHTYIWWECPSCKRQKWYRKEMVGKLCADCNRKDIRKRTKTSNTLKGYRAFRFNKGKKRGTKLGYKCSKEHIEKIRQNMKQQWADPIKREKFMKAIMRAPNGVELKVLDMLNQNFNNEWKFVGDGQVIIAKFCPDFINTNGKKLIIEFFGDFFHEAKDEVIRKKVYKKYGFDTFVIWGRDFAYKYKRQDLLARIGAWINEYEQNEIGH